MAPRSGAEWIYTQQRTWAAEVGLRTDQSGYCGAPEENVPWLTEEIRNEINGGDGDELGRWGGRAKMAALHSSSALAVNVFAYWTTRHPDPLAAAMRTSIRIERIRFEQQFETGAGRRKPNLDVVLYGVDGTITAIESKFAESFRRGAKRLSNRYFPPGQPLWANRGLAGAQAAAERVRAGDAAFSALDAPQLLKHMLGLACAGLEWHLTLLWYAPPVEESERLATEIDRFSALLDSDGDRFSHRTYQSLWSELETKLGTEDTAYREYVGGRYFSERA